MAQAIFAAVVFPREEGQCTRLRADDEPRVLAQAGYTLETWQRLAADLRRQILPAEAVPSDKPNRLGDVYEIRGVLQGVNGVDSAVVATWMSEDEVKIWI